jgi:hypothetical protein
MADKSKIAEMLEHLVNNESEKAEELFHEYVVEKSREIYENLIESEIEEASDEDEDEDKVDEASEETNEDEDDLEEGFEDLDVSEAGDETDDFMSDVSDEEGEDEEGEEEFGGEEEGEEGEEGSEEPATKGDLEDIKMSIEDHFAELEAAFHELAAGEASEEENEPGIHGDHSAADVADEFGAEEGFEPELATVREYTEKIGGATYDKFAKGGDNGQNTKSPVAGKNDMGGTTANIAKGGEGGGTDKGFTNSKPQVDDAGNVNKVGGTKTGSFYSKDGKGHGAEKAGAKESGTNSTSIFRK